VARSSMLKATWGSEITVLADNNSLPIWETVDDEDAQRRTGIDLTMQAKSKRLTMVTEALRSSWSGRLTGPTSACVIHSVVDGRENV
jgi:hypothetical protein